MSKVPKFDDECFFIAPIGGEDSEVRHRSDGVMEYIVRPAAKELGLETIRADQLAKPGQITHQVIEHVLGAKGAVADLTDANANVYYELAVRHTAQLPVALLCAKGERLPFDMAQMRTIFFDHQDLADAARAKEELTAHLKEAIEGAVDSPIAAGARLGQLAQGDAVERTLANLVERVDAYAQIARESEERTKAMFRRVVVEVDRAQRRERRSLTRLPPEDRDRVEERVRRLRERIGDEEGENIILLSEADHEDLISSPEDTPEIEPDVDDKGD